ncbi:hypothetical protein ILYODFUR_033277 [Ilyodon furcidens]|uniref:Uncharacterized protein n=1 Tax=Ilyodon furcidens TaxID=33524 RepID=A0ABV0TGN9_9TELE
MTPFLEAGGRRRLRCWIRVRNQGSRRRQLNRLMLHLLQQQWRGQNFQISMGSDHRLLHLLLNPVIPGALLPTVREVHVRRKHSVRVCVEDPGMQTSMTVSATVLHSNLPRLTTILSTS